jgi:hypothetical protein
MAGALWKKEVVIRPTSTVGVEAAKNWTANWLNSFQTHESNMEDGQYIDYFFGDLFDSRTGNLYRVFSDACAQKYDMTTLRFDLLITANFIPTTMVSDSTDLSEDTDFLITRGALADILSDAVSTAKIVNDFGTISDGKITLTETPLGGIIGGVCQVRVNGLNTYDEVECTVSGTTLDIGSGAGGPYEGAVCLVSYLANN